MARFRWKHLFSARARCIRKADIARDKGDARDAAMLYDSIIRRWGPAFPILMQLGNALKDSGKYLEADATYLEALNLSPNSSDTYLQRGHLAKISGNLVGAEEFYRRAKQINPTLVAAQDELDRLFAWGPDCTRSKSQPPEYIMLRSDLPVSAGVIFHRINNQYRWRRG